MRRQFTENKLVIASHNLGKITEIEDLLKPFGIEVLSGREFKLEEPEEDGDSFIANAEIKSRYFAKHTKLPSLSDDSGLVVPILDGAPGIYSARWAGPEKDFDMAMGNVEKSLIDYPTSTKGQPAHFVCAMSLCWPDGHVESFEGKVMGKLTFPQQGESGFGYDPIFIPDGYDQTFAEMPQDKKQEISHRAQALGQVVQACFKSGS